MRRLTKFIVEKTDSTLFINDLKESFEYITDRNGSAIYSYRHDKLHGIQKYDALFGGEIHTHYMNGKIVDGWSTKYYALGRLWRANFFMNNELCWSKESMYIDKNMRKKYGNCKQLPKIKRTFYGRDKKIKSIQYGYWQAKTDTCLVLYFLTNWKNIHLTHISHEDEFIEQFKFFMNFEIN